MPDRPPEMRFTNTHEGTSKLPNKASPMPQRSPPNPPSSVSQLSTNSRGERGSGQVGVFWSTQHAKTSPVPQEKTRPKFDEEQTVLNIPKQDRSSPAKEESIHARRYVQGNSLKPETNFFHKDSATCMEKPKAPKSEIPATFQNSAFNNFVAEFDNDKLNSGINNAKLRKEVLEEEVERLKGQLKQANLEKAEMTSKFEKLSTICRSQRNEIQELKQNLVASTPSPNKTASKSQASTVPRQASLDLDIFAPSPGAQPWKAFTENPKPQQHFLGNKSAATGNCHSNKQATESAFGFDSRGFGGGSVGAASSQQTSRRTGQGDNPRHFGEAKIKECNTSQPAGWAGF